MRIGTSGLNLIKSFEGLSLIPYQDVIGVWTQGYGSTGGISNDSMPITEAEAVEMLKKDLVVAENAIARLIKVELSQNQFDSLCSFVFNLGSGSLQRSTLRMKLNREDYDGAANEFLKWNKAGGKIYAGLTRRRVAERELFIS